MPLKALASSAPGGSALPSWMCFSTGGLDLLKTTITVLGLHLSGKKCVFLPLMGKVFGTVLVTSGKQSSFLPQKFGFDEV